jgi:DNA polymerase IV
VTKKGRVIFHVDMNSFYASVEAAFDPQLRGKPVAIAGNVEERKGIIVTCSYEARAFGVKTTMPLWEAKRLCPDLIVKTPNFDLYRKASKEMFAILKNYTPLIEPVSIDEGYMDVTDCDFGPPIVLAKTIQSEIYDKLLLPSSIGIAPNKFLAKMASNMKKPMGITVLRKREISNKLWPLNVKEMHGIGEKTAEKLKHLQIYTIGDLAQANEIQLKSLLGINGIRLKQRANGVDDRPVDPESVNDFKSIGNSTTLPKDTTDENEIKTILKKLADSVSQRLKQKHVYAGNIQLTIRYDDRSTITRSKKLSNPIREADDLFHTALFLWEKHWNGDAIRLLGITAQDLKDLDEAYKQLDLFSYEKDAHQEPLIKTLEELHAKYGKGIVTRGVHRSFQNPNMINQSQEVEGNFFKSD